MVAIQNPVEYQQIEAKLINADYKHRHAMMELWKEVNKLHSENKLSKEEFEALSKRIHSKVTV